jgi:membrane protein
MPNTRVRIQAALVGGIVGGTLWQLLQWGYVYFQVGVGKYNAIYGTMAALPIFIVWLYLSWMIVLFGVELTYAIQNIGTVRQNLGAEKVNFACRQQLALTILILTGEAFYRGEPAWGRERIGEDLKLPPRVLGELLDDMVRLNLMVVLCDESGEQLRYQPGRALDALTVQELFQELREDGATYPQNFHLPTRELVSDLEMKMQQAEQGVLGPLTLQDLVLQRVAEKRKQQGDG